MTLESNDSDIEPEENDSPEHIAWPSKRSVAIRNVVASFLTGLHDEEFIAIAAHSNGTVTLAHKDGSKFSLTLPVEARIAKQAGCDDHVRNAKYTRFLFNDTTVTRYITEHDENDEAWLVTVHAIWTESDDTEGDKLQVVVHVDKGVCFLYSIEDKLQWPYDGKSALYPNGNPKKRRTCTTAVDDGEDQSINKRRCVKIKFDGEMLDIPSIFVHPEDAEKQRVESISECTATYSWEHFFRINPKLQEYCTKESGSAFQYMTVGAHDSFVQSTIRVTLYNKKKGFEFDKCALSFDLKKWSVTVKPVLKKETIQTKDEPSEK